jgi:hypothetical protein
MTLTPERVSQLIDVHTEIHVLRERVRMLEETNERLWSMIQTKQPVPPMMRVYERA